MQTTPRAGQMTAGWRLITACLWIGVVASFAAIWNTSERLGLSTWWLGPRGDPRSIVLRLSPFVAPIWMLIATANNVRWLWRFGLGAALITAIVGLGDLGDEPRLAALELIVAGVAALVSMASFTGTYRRAHDTESNPESKPGAHTVSDSVSGTGPDSVSDSGTHTVSDSGMHTVSDSGPSDSGPSDTASDSGPDATSAAAG